MRSRRTVRDFSPEPVPFALIESAIRTAALAPSGANRQPWHFVVVANAGIKRRIREAAEEEERAFYEHRAPDEWLEALAPLGTDWHKPFLEVAPYLIVVFREDYGLAENEAGRRNQRKKLLCDGVGRHCLRILASGFASGGSGHVDTHSESDGISQPDSESSKK